MRLGKYKIGTIYGGYKVLEKINISLKQGAYLCQCKCGVSKIVTTSALKRNQNGCNKCAAKVRPPNYKHREAGGVWKVNRTREYATWGAMMGRCYNKNNPRYHCYGKRGIRVSLKWHKFENFLKDMGRCPPGKSLERICNNGNYTSKNCRWASTVEQARNKRTNRMFTHENKTMCIAAWCEHFGVKKKTIYRRLQKGWSEKEAILTPIKTYDKGNKVL